MLGLDWFTKTCLVLIAVGMVVLVIHVNLSGEI